ncbi:hypothetical protein ACMFMF_006210 [Clarireedia jacksonii]
MQSCREAFQEGFRLRLPYYTFCEYSKWTESHRHGPLPRHYMQPDLDTLWIVENSHCGQYPSFIPQSLSFYAGHHPYRRVKTVAFNDSCWTDPARLSDNTWNTGSLQWIPYDMCEEIVVVLNNWPMSTDRGVIFTESVPATKDSISVDTPSADGDGESKNYFDEAKQRSALMEEFKAYYSKLQEPTGKRDSLDWPVPRIRYLEARPGIEYTAPLKCVYGSKPTAVAPLSVIPTMWSYDHLPGWLRYLVTDDDRYLNQDPGCTDDYSDNEILDNDLVDEPWEFDSEYSSGSDASSDLDSSKDATLLEDYEARL